MSYCKELGKDRVIFATKEDHSVPSTITLKELDENEGPKGLILPNGDINWNCPCLGGMASGPCGPAFRDAFSCFHYSETDPKGSDCIEKFTEMQECMNQFPNVYPSHDDSQDSETEKELEERIMKELEQELDEQNVSTTEKTSDKSDSDNNSNKLNKT